MPMKRLFCLFMCLCLIGVCAAELIFSPYQWYYSEPYFKITPIEDDEFWYSIQEQVYALIDFDTLYPDMSYGLYEIIIVEIDVPHDEILWLFPSEFAEEQIIKMVFCTEDLTSYVVCDGTSHFNGNITMDGSKLVAGTYYLFVLANNIFDFE